jgi:hypothetical protein
MFAAFSPLLAVVAVAPKLCKNGSPVNKLDWDRVCSVWAEQRAGTSPTNHFDACTKTCIEEKGFVIMAFNEHPGRWHPYSLNKQGNRIKKMPAVQFQTSQAVAMAFVVAVPLWWGKGTIWEVTYLCGVAGTGKGLMGALARELVERGCLAIVAGAMQQSIPWWSKLQGWQPGWVQLELEPGTQLVPRVMTPDKMMYLPVCRRQTCNHNNCVLTRGFNATKKSGLVPHACVDLTMLQNDTKGANSRQKKQGPEGGQNGRLSRASGPYPRPRVVVPLL